MNIKTTLIDSAKLIKNNLMVIQPLFFGVLILMFVSKPLFMRTSLDAGFLFAALLLILCISAFIAGWYNCIKYTISLNKKEYSSQDEVKNEQIEILRQFFPGVSEYFLPVTGLFSLYAGMTFLLSYYLDIYLKNLFSKVNIPQELFKIINTGNQQEISNTINSLNYDQIQTIMIAFSIMIISVFIFHFLILWFGPSLFYKTKNPIMAIIENFRFLFRNILPSVVIFTVMTVINIALSFMMMLFGNGILSFIPFLFFFFYIQYYVCTVFLYYEQKTETCSINGSKFDREV